jgi:uncharacterized Tic20 family protein
MNAMLHREDATLADRQWAAGAHVAALALALLTSWTAGFAGMLAAGAVYLLKRDDAPFAAQHAREAFNFNLSMFLYACGICVVGFLLLGATVLTLGIGLIVTLPAGLMLLVAVAALAVMWLVCSIVAAVKAWNGEHYRYPLTLRLL